MGNRCVNLFVFKGNRLHVESHLPYERQSRSCQASQLRHRFAALHAGSIGARPSTVKSAVAGSSHPPFPAHHSAGLNIYLGFTSVSRRSLPGTRRAGGWLERGSEWVVGTGRSRYDRHTWQPEDQSIMSQTMLLGRLARRSSATGRCRPLALCGAGDRADDRKTPDSPGRDSRSAGDCSV